MKRELLERGTHIPLIIRFPGAMNGGTVNEDLVSAVDFAPTVLSLAGVKIPSHMQGQAFLGVQKSGKARQYVFAARDRMDEHYDRVRMVRDKNFRYLYNYMPEKPYYQDISYRLGIPMMAEILQLKAQGKLDQTQLSWFASKPEEELYDVANDPYELKNLAGDVRFKEKHSELRAALQDWTRAVGDMGGIPEKEMIRQMWNGGDEPPATALPKVHSAKGGVKLNCATPGASIGYRIVKPGAGSHKEMHTLTNWDITMIFGNSVINGQLIPAQPVWQVYTGKTIRLDRGDTLRVQAMRIGFKPATIEYADGKTTVAKPVK